jgi:hypothetical protein
MKNLIYTAILGLAVVAGSSEMASAKPPIWTWHHGVPVVSRGHQAAAKVGHSRIRHSRRHAVSSKTHSKSVKSTGLSSIGMTWHHGVPVRSILSR